MYTARFMTTNTEASPITGTHCLRVNARSRGRPTASRIAAATHWRIATTATGPITGKASAPTIVGLESRYGAVAADDPLARRRQLRLADLANRVLAVDPRTGTTTPNLWPPGSRPEVEEIHDIDDWLAVIAAGQCVGVTAESTLTQYRRQGLVFRRLRDAPPVPVRLLWWRDDPHPATSDVVALLAELYHPPRSR